MTRPNHVPYQQRQTNDPIYIGFEQPRRTNGLGIAGFVLSLFGFLTFGLLSPIALFLCFLGLFRSPRGFAATGLVLSLIPTSIWATAIIAENHHRHQRHIEAQMRPMKIETEKSFEQAYQEFVGYWSENDALPDQLSGNRMMMNYKDGWGTELMYEPKSNAVSLRCAGPDKTFFTDDDFAKQYEFKGATTASGSIKL